VAWILLSNASVLSLQDGILTLRFARDGDLKGFSTSGCDADLKRVLSAGFGLNVMVKGVVGGDQNGPPPGPGPVAGGHGAHGAHGAQDRPPVAARPQPVPPAASEHDDEPPDDMPPDEPDDDEMPPDRPSSHGQPAPAAELTGMDLIQRELGGQVISEIEG
jgi:DNA polymerase-3 subunit gamma/tau